jgi:hypothetical protein
VCRNLPRKSLKALSVNADNLSKIESYRSANWISGPHFRFHSIATANKAVIDLVSPSISKILINNLGCIVFEFLKHKIVGTHTKKKRLLHYTVFPEYNFSLILYFLYL